MSYLENQAKKTKNLQVHMHGNVLFEKDNNTSQLKSDNERIKVVKAVLYKI